MMCNIVVVSLLFAVIGIQSSSGQEWKKADLTNYWSYPPCCDNPDYPDQSECEDYSGCKYRGQFAFVSGTKSESWVKSNNIIAINGKDEKKYKLKTFELKAKNGKTIKAKVYDKCSDGDCNGCCTKNSKKTGFLIDIERNTMKKFGQGDGIVEWRCVDC